MSVLFAEAPMAKASDLEEMLRRHYIPEGRLPAGIFATEIQSPDGSRRADALWCPWSDLDNGLVGHEIKVSRSDLIVELADPMKADPWAKYCREWWLVVSHPALIDGLQIPTAWGVMAPPSGRRRRSMTIVRHAPRLKPMDTGRAWRRIAAWSEHRTAARIRTAEYEASRHRAERERLEREMLDVSLADRGRTDRRAAAVGQILTALDARPGWYRPELDVDEIVAAITDVEAHHRLAKRLRDEIRWLADEARRVADPAKDIAAELERLAKTGAPA